MSEPVALESFQDSPRKDPREYEEFVTLSESFTVSYEDIASLRFDPPKDGIGRPDHVRNVWSGRDWVEDKRKWLGKADEVLVRTKSKRWVLLYISLPGHRNADHDDPNRELTPADAARWLMLNEYELPDGLSPDLVDVTPGRQAEPSRLDREWRHSAPPKEPAVVLGKQSEAPKVRGKQKSRLGVARYNVVMALLEAGERGLTKDELAKKSGHSDAVNVLKRLAGSDPDWDSVIQMAGKPGSGYRIVT